jgi:hypothetical protein
MSVNRLPPVGRIRAVHLPEGGPRVPKSLTIEYSDRSNASKWYQLEVPFVDAMHLLALLKGAKTTSAIKSPLRQRRPRRTNAPGHCDRLTASGLRGYPGNVQEVALALWTEATEAVREYRSMHPQGALVRG